MLTDTVSFIVYEGNWIEIPLRILDMGLQTH